MKKTIFAMFVILIFLLSGCSHSSQVEQKAVQSPSPAPADAQVVIQEPVQTVQPAPTQPSAKVELPLEADVEITGFAFSPEAVTIKKGGSVTWIQLDSEIHEITANNNEFLSPGLSKGQKWSFKFDQEGIFEYHCRLHPSMNGKVIVG